MVSRYVVQGGQVAAQSGSAGAVLANKLGITDAAEMAEAELMLLQQLYDAVLVDNLPLRALTVVDLFTWHRRWLGNVYAFAGERRSVNAGKDGFWFAAADRLPSLLDEYERDCLALHTPAPMGDRAQLVQAIAITHAELILIHPFIEGNGRIARLLADVMAVQAGHEPLDYSTWDVEREAYFAAIRAAVGRDYSGVQRSAFGGCRAGRSLKHCAQRASLRCENLLWPLRSLASIADTVCPVSMAVELATARRMAARLGALRVVALFLMFSPLCASYCDAVTSCKNSGG